MGAYGSVFLCQVFMPFGLFVIMNDSSMFMDGSTCWTGIPLVSDLVADCRIPEC
jgi:hypothetical protein